MTFSNFLYRLLRLNNDLRAARKGPRAMAGRAVRKVALKATTRALNVAMK